jgi:hypothetical protein
MMQDWGDRAIALLDTLLSGLHGWMPVVAALAGIWVWRQYRQLGWFFLGTVALLRYLAAQWIEGFALPPNSNLVSWFVLCVAVYGAIATGATLQGLTVGLRDRIQTAASDASPPVAVAKKSDD